MKYLKTFESFINESKSVKKLEREFKALNRQYVKLDKELDKASMSGLDSDELSDELERIQQRMSEISAELESVS